MPLPELIEIVPPTRPVRAEVTVPGSKSITNRALVLAALAAGDVTLEGALWSEDTQVMIEALRKLGFAIAVTPEPDEPCNRRITVRGLGGRIPHGGTRASPLDLFVGNAGTAARFLAALACLGNGVYRLAGSPRMHERPQAALLAALRQLGCRVESSSDRLPAVIHGMGTAAAAAPRRCTVNIQESSQFASALLLCARTGGWQVEVVGQDAETAPYVTMTRRLLEVFPHRGGCFQIEPDASSGSYFWAAGWLLSAPGAPTNKAPVPGWWREASPVQVRHWPTSGWQVDAAFPDFLPLPRTVSRRDQLGDSILTAIALAADAAACPGRAADEGVVFTELGRLRLQECERVAAIRTELTRCGARVVEAGDTLTVYPGRLHGATLQTYNDHRLAMCLAILGLNVPGIRLHNPACVRKTFPSFFQKLAAPPPAGTGVTILNAQTGGRLREDELFAG